MSFLSDVLNRIRRSHPDPIDLEALTPQELCAVYFEELERAQGKKIAEASVIFYKRGWFYVGIAWKNGWEIVQNPICTPMRRKRVIANIRELKLGEK